MSGVLGTLITYVKSTPSSFIFFWVSQRTYAESVSRSSVTNKIKFGLIYNI